VQNWRKKMYHKKRASSHQFDEWAPSYDSELRNALGSFASQELSEYAARKARLIKLSVEKLLGKPSSELSCCEGGCGVGNLTSQLNQYFKITKGWEPSPASHKIANLKIPSIEIMLGDNPIQLFKNERFDCVVASCVLHHIAATERARFLLSSIKILKENGVLIVVEHNPYNPFTRCAVARCAFDQDAELLTLSAFQHSLALFNPKSVSGLYFGFMPNPMLSEKILDPWLGWLPFGAQWMASVLFSKS
jgi:SAM-dependent methyltransferase